MESYTEKNGPARTEYYENGNIEYVTYFKHDLCHREDGPAGIWYDEDGNEKRVEYYINGERCDDEYIKK